MFVYGKGVTITGLNGVSQTIYRPGFEVTVAKPGAAPSDPGPAPPSATTTMLAQLDGRAGSNGGAPKVPTEVTVANSGIANVISANVQESVQAAAKTQPQQAQPANVTPVITQAQLNNQNVQVSGASATAIGGGTVSFSRFLANPTAQGTPIPTATPPTTPTTPVTPVTPVTPNTPATPMMPTTPVTPPSPVVVSVAGLAKVTTTPPTAAGFNLQTAAYRLPYTSGTITYPVGSVPQNGTFSTIINGAQVTLSPLTPGTTTAVTANALNVGTASGTATTTADGKFFYANLTSTTPGSQGTHLFIFGGVPVDQSFYAGNLPAQITTFQIQPDGALAAGSQTQTIPFLPSNYGGTMSVLPGNVSPLYVATGANSPFGAANSQINNFVSPKFLQASLAVNGQGASQTSALVINTGNFFTSADTGLVAAAGPVRGTVMLNATSPAVHVASGIATVPDGNNNALFGTNTLSGFVLDQNQYNFSGNYVPALASAAQSGATTANYGFNQPATTAPLPSTVPGTRQALAEAGFFGGIMSHTANPNTGSPYVLTGAVAPLQSTLNNDRVAATFTGGDPFTSAQSGINSVVLNFGDVTAGTNSSRGTYINNQIYAATDSPTTASSINGNPLALPPNSTTAAPSPSIAMVTSGTVPNNSWMPSGVTPCSCQYLQWGYWTGQVTSTATQGLGVARTDRAFINTWVAGMPTINMPTSGVGTYNGAAVGTVYNGGASYLAAGGFNQTYNFGAHTGTINITNFDNANYVGSLSGSGSAFAGPLTGPPDRNGAVVGSFYGPSANETGGSFNISNRQSAPALKYLASGIFAGR